MNYHGRNDQKKNKGLFSQKAVYELFHNASSSSSQVFQSAFPAPEPPNAQHVFLYSSSIRTSSNHQHRGSKGQHGSGGRQQPFYHGDLLNQTGVHIYDFFFKALFFFELKKVPLGLPRQ